MAAIVANTNGRLAIPALAGLLVHQCGQPVVTCTSGSAIEIMQYLVSVAVSIGKSYVRLHQAKQFSFHVSDDVYQFTLLICCQRLWSPLLLPYLLLVLPRMALNGLFLCWCAVKNLLSLFGLRTPLTLPDRLWIAEDDVKASGVECQKTSLHIHRFYRLINYFLNLSIV